MLGNKYEAEKDIQILIKEKIHIDTNKVFMWIFDYKDFKVKDIVELADYEIYIDEETNANSIIKILKETTAEESDIIVIKKNNEKIYWGVVQDVENENGGIAYQISAKYLTNMFDQEIELKRTRINTETVEEGYYVIRSKLDDNTAVDVQNASAEVGANVNLCNFNDTKAQRFKISKNSDGTYQIKAMFSGLVIEVENGIFAIGTNVRMYTKNDGAAQKWHIRKVADSTYTFFCYDQRFCLDVQDSKTDNYTNIFIFESLSKPNQQFSLEKIDEPIIREEGIEDFIKKVIEDNFINNEDTFVNRPYLKVIAKTHTKKEVSVTNVNNNIFNLHTYMTNCTQNYNIVYDFEITNKELIITIENKELKKKIIDVNAHSITNYTETFEKNVISKVTVLTKNEGKYVLYLRKDRTTTEDMLDKNRIRGKETVVYTEKLEDARQTALDTIKANSYNHNVSFKFNTYIKQGTPVAVKTKKSVILDSYISSVKITNSKFYEYQLGNIRNGFWEKQLQKERKK